MEILSGMTTLVLENVIQAVSILAATVSMLSAMTLTTKIKIEDIKKLMPKGMSFCFYK